MTSFIKEEYFNELVAKQKKSHEILHWSDVPINQIFHIEKVEKIETKKGGATVVTLCDSEGKSIRAFATSLLSKDLETSGSYFIKSLGLKQSSNGKDYYAYDLVLENDDSGYETI